MKTRFPNMSCFTIFILTILLFHTCIWSNEISFHCTADEGEESTTEMGDQTITDPDEGFANSTRVLNGNLTIEGGGVYTLENAHLLVNSTPSMKYVIHVKPGGTLILRNSSIDPWSDFGYGIVVEGSIEAINASLSGVYHILDYTNSGLQIYSNDVMLKNVTIFNPGPSAVGMLLYNVSIEITDSTIYGEYNSMYLVDCSQCNIDNCSFSSGPYAGQGIRCWNSSFHLEDCRFEENFLGVNIISGEEIEILNTSFLNNGGGIVVSPGGGSPLIKGCSFKENQLSAMELYDDATVENCEFQYNVVPGVLKPVGALNIVENSNDTSVIIRNSTFQENHNGIFSLEASLELVNCSFTNNTQFRGTNGVIVIGPEDDQALSITDCDFLNNPVAVEIITENTSSGYSLEMNEFEKNGIGIRSWGNALRIQNNTFRENDCAIEERYTRSSVEVGNTFDNNSMNRRFMVQARIQVQDGYDIPLEGAVVSFDPVDSVDNYSPEVQTNSLGLVVKDIIWEVDADREYQYHPYGVEASFKGAQESYNMDSYEQENITIIVPFPRPVLQVCDLEMENTGFSFFQERPREDEISYIRFTVKNTGEGNGENIRVEVRTGNILIESEEITLKAGEKKEFKVKWIPEREGKINISVNAFDPDELNATDDDLVARYDVGENQGGYYYLIVLVTMVILGALIWWMVTHVEGVDDDMAKMMRKFKIRLALLFESWSRKLMGDYEREEEQGLTFVPSGEIYSWDGQPTMNGTGVYTPWSLEEENIQRMKKKDIMTIEIRIPLPEPEIILDEGPEMETFEWVTSKGKKEKMQVDKRTLVKLNHPKMFICSLCDRNFISIDETAKCPWCAGKAYFMQEM